MPSPLLLATAVASSAFFALVATLILFRPRRLLQWGMQRLAHAHSLKLNPLPTPEQEFKDEGGQQQSASLAWRHLSSSLSDGVRAPSYKAENVPLYRTRASRSSRSPPTEALLDFFVPSRSIWPSYYIRATREAEMRAHARDKLVVASRRRPNTRITQPWADRSTAGQKASQLATLTGAVAVETASTTSSRSTTSPPSRHLTMQFVHQRSSQSPVVSLNARVRELLEQIPSTDPSEASGEEENEVEDEQLASNGLSAIAGTYRRSASRSDTLTPVTSSLHLDDPASATSLDCSPIFISVAQLERDWHSGKIQTVNPSWSFADLLLAIRASARDSTSPAASHAIKTECNCCPDEGDDESSGNGSSAAGRIRQTVRRLVPSGWCIHLVYES